MQYKNAFGRKIFILLNYILLITASFICLLPLVNVLAISFSSSTAAMSGVVKLWPVDFTLKSYEFIVDRPAFINSFLVAFERVGLGVPISFLITILSAYPLSKGKKDFRYRGVYVWFFLISMLFGGGLIPWYMVIKYTGLIDSIWALVWPCAVQVFYIILLLNFFRELPKELNEAAYIDGAGHWRILWQIYVPLSKPALATIILFITIYHWNSWFDGLILMNRPEHYPLQSYMQTIIVGKDMAKISEKDIEILRLVNDRTSKAAQVFIGTVPILILYPFLQKYFTTGIVIGSVKG
jgi:ABC-type sugar transport system, permease component